MEPIASPTRSDLLQKINEKKYHVNSDYLLHFSGMLFSSHVPFRKSLHRR